jgi:hypothetical protein
MRSWIVPVVALLMTACSDAPTETKAKTKAPEASAAPHTGKEAFYKTYPVARTWASDCQPVRIRSYNLKQVPSADGKAGAWEVTFASLTKGRAKTVSWSAIEGEGLHVGVFAGQEESWSATMAKPFPVQALVADTPAVFETAKTNGAAYFKRPGERPPVTFLLELTSRFPNPAWRVYWGDSASGAEFTVFVDATTGEFLQKN